MPISFKKIAAAAVLSMAGAVSQAAADVITYDLVDTPQGRWGDGGFYLNTGNGFQAYSFEQNGAGAKLAYDDDRGIVRVYGKGYNTTTGEFEDFNVSYNNVVRNGDKLTLQNMGDVGFFGDTSTNGKGFNLTLGDRLRGDGWLTNPETGGHFGDFHFAGVRSSTPGSVPAPAPLALLTIAGLFFAWRRRSRA